MYTEKISSEVNARLLEYIFSKCDYFSLTYQEDDLKKYLDMLKNIVFEVLGYHKEDLMQPISKTIIKEMTDKLYAIKDSEEMQEFLASTHSYLGGYQKEYAYNHIQGCVSVLMRRLNYEEESKKFVEKYKDELVVEKVYYYSERQKARYNHPFPEIQTICYQFVLNEKTKKLILGHKKSLLEFRTPLEDLSFYKGNKCFFRIFDFENEGRTIINCESEEEYEYLKSIGVQFYSEKYMEEKSLQGQYEDPYIELF